MRLFAQYVRDLISGSSLGWNRFWFTPADSTTLCLIRIATGAMLVYTHAVWWTQLDAFFGPHPWMSVDALRTGGISPWAWSHLWYVSDSSTLHAIHALAMAAFVAMTLGLATRYACIASWLFTVSYAHRGTGALFGLDQINALLTLYLIVAPCGEQFSLDALLKRRRSKTVLIPQPSITANIAARLIQVHMCVIYLFAGLSKLQGPAWWDGSAMWLAAANLEYQTLDLTWMVHSPWLVNALTHITIVWEVSYIALVWPRLTRPIVIALAIPLHLGIASGLGMVTFGTIMIVANAAFIPGDTMRAFLGLRTRTSDEDQPKQSVAAQPVQQQKPRGWHTATIVPARTPSTKRSR